MQNESSSNTEFEHIVGHLWAQVMHCVSFTIQPNGNECCRWVEGRASNLIYDGKHRVVIGMAHTGVQRKGIFPSGVYEVTDWKERYFTWQPRQGRPCIFQMLFFKSTTGRLSPTELCYSPVRKASGESRCGSFMIYFHRHVFPLLNPQESRVTSAPCLRMN